MRSVFFAATAADSVNNPKAAIAAAATGPVLPLSPSSIATRFSNTNFDHYGGRGGREGISPYSRTFRGAGFAHAHAPSPSAAALRLPASRPKKPVASRREEQERRGCGVDVDEVRFSWFRCVWTVTATIEKLFLFGRLERCLFVGCHRSEEVQMFKFAFRLSVGVPTFVPFLESFVPSIHQYRTR